MMKRISFVGRSLDDLKRFPENAMREAGFQLDRAYSVNQNATI